MKRLISILLPSLFSVLVAAALIGVKPMCGVFLYQPEVPAVLKK
ncbi:MAG: cyclic lactone autoinducer peptide [Thermacetogeniaceae bacterium]|jgi:cyclic lactone autoinducer peptide